ncbi:apolipophorins-like [Actinia tenebrosa]|uniref:Apolipophorins-like n=1 Tax=Actinia tenebrosa TaxID=6105 RepID=A0A6P8H676_ACTTE|nr:apolipophorins-like [Actinia tenebrosa]
MKALAILLALACGTLAAPRPMLMRPTCENSENRFIPNRKYVYRYVGMSTTGIQGTTDEKAEIKITARFHVNSVSSCVFHLEVDDVQLSERSSPDAQFTISKGKKEFVRDLEGNPLTFTSVNGQILDIKTSKAEPVYVTNIKRGMLSALQLEFKEEGESTVKERDIAGDCKTRYLRMIKDDKEDVYKVKNLTECTNRSNMDTTLMHPVFYTTGSGKRTPLDCTSLCHYKIEKKQIYSVECKETHLLIPLSYQSSGVMTTVTQKIVLEKMSFSGGYRSNLEDASSERSDLRFDFNVKEKMQEKLQGDTTSVDKILQDLVGNKTPKETSWMAPLAYTELVFQFRRLNLQGIKNTWTKFADCSRMDLCPTKQLFLNYRQLIVDALIQCGTESCAEFMIQHIRETPEWAYVFERGSETYRKQLLSGLSWVRNPTEKILDNVWTLMKEKKDILPENTITIMGSMMRTHCEVYPKNCKDDLSGLDHFPKVLEISRSFSSMLYMNLELCKATPETVDEIIFILRAIGNSRFVETSPVDLVYCALKSNYKNISAAALEVLGDLKLDYQTRKGLKTIYKDYAQDPEIRMMAYLAWMKEPTKEDIKTVMKTLQEEINTQVGSLVWSHLTSMNTSVEPTSGHSIGTMIEEVLRETQTSLRYFNTTSKSTVWHKSIFNEKNNLGMSADSHVLYHPESLLPRHTHFNFSVDVLGGAFPVLEASTRTEGLELLWDKLFGPRGHFPDTHISDLVKTQPKKRSLDDLNELQYLHDMVNMPRTSTPSGLFSIKLFGNELALFTLKDLKWLQHEVPMLDWVEMLINLRNGVDDMYTKHWLFLQDSFTIPTSIGLPLTLSLNGTAVGSVHVSAKGDLHSWFWDWRPSIKFKGSVKPSAAVSMSGMMSVNAFHSKVGILVNGTLFTSAKISANVTYKKEETFKFHYNVDEKPEEIFNMSSMLFKQVNDKKTPISGIKQRRKASVCISSIFNVNKYVGMDLCSNISVPISWDKTMAPFLPLTGPANFSIKLHRSDPKLTTYKLEVNKTKFSKSPNKTCLELSTPGSSHKRILLMNLTTLDQPDRFQLNISVGDHEANWTVLNFTRNSNSKMLMAEMNITLPNISLYHTAKVHEPSKIISTKTSLIRGPYGNPVTVMFLNANLDYSSRSTGSMIFNLMHRPLDFTWQVKVRHSSSELKTNILCVMKCRKRPSPLLNHRMEFNITQIDHVRMTSENITEKGLRVEMRMNETRRMSLFGSKKVVKTIGHKFSTYFTTFTFYNRTTLKPYTTSLNLTLHENLVTKWNEMALNMTYKNNSIALETSMKNTTEKKSICLIGRYLNGTSWNKTDFISCIAFLNGTEVKNLIWNLKSMNTTHKLNATWLRRPDVHMFVNYACKNESLAKLTVSYRKTNSMKFLGVNGNMGNWNMDLQHSFQDEVKMKTKLRRILIVHKAKNGTESYMYNAFNLTFLNSTTMKNMLVGLTLSTRTKDMLEKESKLPRQFVNRTASWKAEMKNDTEILNVSSLFDYQVMDQTEMPNKLILKKQMHHTLFWHKTNSLLNVSVDFPNTTLGLNCSGNFIKGINMSANLNDSLLWNAYITERKLISNVTLWNRTLMMESRTCNRSQSLFLNISTWNMVNRTAFNGSITWYLNATTKKTAINVMLVNVNAMLLNTTFVNTSLQFSAFALNDSHLNISFVRRNMSDLYKESSLEFRPGGRVYMEFNATSLKRIWRELNLETFDMPRKLLNITVNFTSRGVNMKKTGKHLKILMQKLTREISAWKFTQQNLGDNLSNLTKKLLKVTSHSLPDVTSDYDIYLKKNRSEIMKFWKHLTRTIVAIPRHEIKSKEMAKELIQSLKYISESFNKTSVIGNLSEVLSNIVLYNSSGKPSHLKNLTDNITFYLRNLTNDITYYLRNASKDMGSWKIHSKMVDSHIKEILPKVKDKMLYILNETEMVITEIHEHLRILRDDVAFLSDHFVNETYPEVYNKSNAFYNNLKMMASPTTFAGGIMHPCWMNISEILNTSIFNITIHHFHKYLIYGTALETILPFLSQPDHITEVFHESVLDRSLEKMLNNSLNKAMEMYNATLRLPSWHVNKTHDNIVYARDLVVMLYNDTDNVMTSISKKNLTEIVELYINQTRNMTVKTWNLTMSMMESILNVSIPVHGRFDMLKKNVTELYWNTSEKMPWARPLIRLWNTTMFSLAKNNTPERLIESWMPKIVNFTLNKASHFAKYVNECLTDEQTQTPRIQMAYSKKVLKVSTIHKMESRPNFTKYFLKVSRHYLSFSTWIFNMIKEPKRVMANSSNITMQWANVLFNGTSKVFDEAESVVNCSLVINKTNNLTNQYVKTSPMMMEVHTWVRNKTLEKMFNKTNIPYSTLLHSTLPYFMWNTIDKMRKMEAQDLAILFTPKNETAFVINQRNFITFDKRSFRVPEIPKPGCSFLLARDFLDGEFTVLATQNSYIIMTPELNIEIYKDGTIKANTAGQPQIVKTDLPVGFDSVYAVRDGPYIRVISDRRGFEFELEMEHFIFGAYISGFYHNRTLGLLGTNNGEISDEWRSPLGKNRTVLEFEKFLNSWLVSKDSECYIRRPVQRQQCQPKESSRCEELLKSKMSPFQKCFDVIDPKPFFEACIKDVTSSCETSEPERMSHCNVSAAYVRACVKNGVDISVPIQCADCNEQTRFMVSTREVDIMVISSEGRNMKQVTRNIPKLISRINMNLLNNNIRPQFGLVGFSGRQPLHWKGHTHTLNGKFLGSNIELIQASKTLDFASYDMNISDGYMGIYHATKYPFRPGAKKIFLLVTDSRRVKDSDLTSDFVSKAMKSIDAKLIVIGDYYFKYGMYGGDTDRYRYYRKDPEGSIRKNRQRLPEEDEYVKVVSKTEGAVFMVKRFEKDKTNKYFSEMIKNVMLKYSKGKRCMQCRCVPDEVGKGREVCKETSNFWCNWN